MRFKIGEKVRFVGFGSDKVVEIVKDKVDVSPNAYLVRYGQSDLYAWPQELRPLH